MRSFLEDTTKALLACVSLLACSADASRAGGAGTAGPGGSGGMGGVATGGSGGTAVGVGGAFTGSGGGSGDVCPVYLVGYDNAFYSFYPPTLETKQLGYLDCPFTGLYPGPFSMAIDRKGIAWVLSTNGLLYNVDIKTLACTAMDDFKQGQAGFLTFGMGFVSDTPGGDAETLYASDYDGKGLVFGPRSSHWHRVCLSEFVCSAIALCPTKMRWRVT